MFPALIAIFIILPLLELWLFFTVGSRIGFPQAFLGLIVVGFIGAALARQQGYKAVVRIQQEVRQGRMPADAMLDGMLILGGALLLLAPGFISDIIGLTMLVPPTRRLIRRWLKGRLRQAVDRRTLVFWSPRRRGGGPGEPEQRRKELEG